jgi:hypothetical protein
MPTNTTDNEKRIAVEKITGAEETEYGTVAYTIHETDGVDVVFTDGNASHFSYGETLRLI